MLLWRFGVSTKFQSYHQNDTSLNRPTSSASCGWWRLWRFTLGKSFLMSEVGYFSHRGITFNILLTLIPIYFSFPCMLLIISYNCQIIYHAVLLHFLFKLFQIWIISFKDIRMLAGFILKNRDSISCNRNLLILKFLKKAYGIFSMTWGEVTKSQM